MNTSKTPYTLRKSKLKSRVEIQLPASKSISNRVLIIDALGNEKSRLNNLSKARDTQTMMRLLSSDEDVLDVLDAGTTMRFLAAYLAATNQHKALTGTSRMKERPIGILVDALRSIGADISYQEKEGFPPIQINGFEQTSNKVNIRGDVSSQYISALLMIAPTLLLGLEINLEGKIGSRPYIEMTLKIMEQFGVSHSWRQNLISIPPQKYYPTDFTVEPDWSAASYWYSFVALSPDSTVTLRGLKDQSLQGDRAIVEIMAQLGVQTDFSQDGALLSKCNAQMEFSYDFTHCPDLAQTVVVLCAAKGIKAKLTGLESLKIKETDRITALQNELGKLGAELTEHEDHWKVIPSRKLPEQVHISTYDDHRMAMAFAPLCLLMEVGFDHTDVVKKSYPGFWEDVQYSTIEFPFE